MEKSAYVAENADSLALMEGIIGLISPEDLRQPMPAGWTVAAVLVHLAFWDQRALVLLQKWQQEGIGPSLIDTEVINEVTRRLCLAIPPRAAAKLAIACGQEVDALIEHLSPEFLAEVAEKGTTVHLNRGEHRRQHLGEIMQALEIEMVE